MTAPELDLSSEVEVLFFQIGAERLGVDVCQVIRIGQPGVPGVRRSPLGSMAPKRSLVFRADDSGAEGALEVDMVLGVRTIPVRDLRRVPGAACMARHAIGFWLDGDHPVLLIDLPATLPLPAPDEDQPFT